MNKKNKKFSDPGEYDYLTTSSVNDCTGLIPAAITDEDEIEYYEELYPFLPQAVSKHTDDD